MWLRAGIRRALLAQSLQCAARRNHLNVKQIIADECDHFAVGVKRVLTEHRACGKSFGVAELREKELDRFAVCGHLFSFSGGERTLRLLVNCAATEFLLYRAT